MTDQVRNPEATVDSESQNADAHSVEEAAAKRGQFGQTGPKIDAGLGQMGGAGASGAPGPDIAKQSVPVSVNPADRSAGQ